ncbi:hypothetical protein K7T73_12545 [Bacillus badius]|uniref:hypothetical protein n=1 Tax=Bacillus badius TaxID=1455 RepID=UPI001CBA92B4|nr:hypothetical protein [Bacillus badius]UAT29429.1 hypothetical protein K7T73_12545 [Bacillus badius]
MVTMTVYVNTDVFCWIVNTLNKSITHEWGTKSLKAVSLKKHKKYPHEIQVPIQIIGQFYKRDMTTIDLFKLQELNNLKKD